MREEALKQHQLLIEGHEVYEEYCQRGQQAVTEKQVCSYCNKCIGLLK